MIKKKGISNGVKKNIPKSLKKHIRREKARIRRHVLDPKEQKELILKLLEKTNRSAFAKATADKENDN